MADASNDERVQQLLAQVPRDWRSWAELSEPGAVTEVGLDVVDWATEVAATFYGDEWFARNIDARSHPLFSMYDYPLRNPIAAVRHIERAARIALLPDSVRDTLSSGVNGIRRSVSDDEFDHLDLVLEVIGLALRDGWQVDSEAPSAEGRLPDLSLRRSGFTYVIEVTSQGTDRNFRATERQGHLIQNIQWQMEFAYAVDCITRIAGILSDEEVAEFGEALEGASARTSETEAPIEFDLGFASAGVYPRGQRPGTTSHEGPMLGDDLWPRFAARLRDKAEQTRGSDRAWIRIDELGGLFMLTGAYHFSLPERLGTLIQNIAVELDGYPHVQGVIVSHGASPDWTPMRPEVGVGEGTSNSVVVERRLPGGRRRTTYVIRLLQRGLILPPHLVVEPERWYANESTWLDWALNQLGRPAIDRCVRGESYRALIRK
jgi:hypothetical protein